MVMRVKMKIPKEESVMRLAYRPARLESKARRAKDSRRRTRARTVSASGRRAAAAETPKRRMLAAIDQ